MKLTRESCNRIALLTRTEPLTLAGEPIILRADLPRPAYTGGRPRGRRHVARSSSSSDDPDPEPPPALGRFLSFIAARIPTWDCRAKAVA
jgi:hypothetical protein